MIQTLPPLPENDLAESLERLEHEYSLRDEVDSDWAARPLALRLPRERQAPAPPEVIAGTLAYIAPKRSAHRQPYS
jgi:hypothetical protein